MMEWTAPRAEDAFPDHDQLRVDLVEPRRAFQDIAETAYSSDGLVGATVDANGDLTELVLDPRIYRTTDSAALAGTITATIKEAVSAATARRVELTKPFLPDAAPFDPGPADDMDRAFGPAPRYLTRDER